jgi:hypothetical protein
MPRAEISLIVSVQLESEAVEPWLLAVAGINRVISDADQIERVEVRDPAGSVQSFTLQELTDCIDAEEGKVAKEVEDTIAARGYRKSPPEPA